MVLSSLTGQNKYALELLHDTVHVEGIPGWVCLLCRHNRRDAEREQVVDVIHQPHH